MENLTKEQKFIKDAYEGNFDLDMCKQWKELIEEHFPEFKRIKLIPGQWYKRNQEILKWNSGNQTIGFCSGGRFGNDYYFSTSANPQHVTEVELADAFRAEAIRRGFSDKRKNFICLKHQNKVNLFPIKDWYYHPELDSFWTAGRDCGGYCIYEDGKWADVIESITKKEAEKILGKHIID